MLAPGCSDLRRYDGAVVQRDQRETTVGCAVQPRDVQVIRDVWQHKFLTGPQLLELHWPGRVEQVGRRRLTKLFAAGYLERFRPITRTGGSFPWTYHLGEHGHRLLRETHAIPARARYEHRTIYDYRYVLHEIHLNAWTLAWRRHLRELLVDWQGETEIEPPAEAKTIPTRLHDDRSIEGLHDTKARLIRPDATLHITRHTTDGTRTYLIEYDRTRRIDKNFEKFRRYDAYLCWWWRHTNPSDSDPPYVIFVCQDDQHRELFLQAADRELTGHLWHPTDGPDSHEHTGRDRILFATEANMYRGELIGWRVPALPPGHPSRYATDKPRGVRLPGTLHQAAGQADDRAA